MKIEDKHCSLSRPDPVNSPEVQSQCRVSATSIIKLVFLLTRSFLPCHRFLRLFLWRKPGSSLHYQSRLEQSSAISEKVFASRRFWKYFDKNKVFAPGVNEWWLFGWWRLLGNILTIWTAVITCLVSAKYCWG